MPYLVLDIATAEAPPSVVIGAPLTSVGETLASFQDELELELGRRGDITPAELAVWINLSYRKVSMMLTIKQLFASFPLSTVALQPFYELPPEVAWIREVMLIDDVNYLAGGREMEQIDDKRYRLLEDLEDEPTKWFRYNNMLVLYGTPDTEYDLALDVRVRPADLEDATDSPILPVEFHEVIGLYAKNKAFRALRMYPEAREALNDATSELRSILNTDAEEVANANSVMQPIRSRGSLYQGRR